MRQVTQWVPPGCGARASSLLRALYQDEAAKVAERVGLLERDPHTALAFVDGYIHPLAGYDRERAVEALRGVGVVLDAREGFAAPRRELP